MTPYRERVLFRDVLGRLAFCVVLLTSAAGQQQTGPDLELQREAMKKFAFLVGKWSGEARWFRLRDTLDLNYTQEVHYEENGLVLRLDGRGRQKSDGQFVIGSANIISYDDQLGTYRIRLYPPPQHEGELKVDEDWKGMAIDFVTPPERKTHAVLRVNEEGFWTEAHWVTEGSAPPWMFLHVVMRRQKGPPHRKTGPPSQSAGPQEKTEQF